MPGLRKGHQLQMAIDLPEILDVTGYGRVAIIQILPESKGGRDTRLGIHVPARRKAQVDTSQGKHVEPPCQDSIRRLGVARDLELTWQFGNPRVPLAHLGLLTRGG